MLRLARTMAAMVKRGRDDQRADGFRFTVPVRVHRNPVALAAYFKPPQMMSELATSSALSIPSAMSA